MLYALTRYLNAFSPEEAQARLVAKFAEKEGEKMDRLVEMCLKWDERARNAELKFLKSEECEEAEEEEVRKKPTRGVRTENAPERAFCAARKVLRANALPPSSPPPL